MEEELGLEFGDFFHGVRQDEIFLALNLCSLIVDLVICIWNYQFNEMLLFPLQIMSS